MANTHATERGTGATAKLGAPKITAALLSGIAHEEVSDEAVRNPRHHVPSRFTPSLYGTSRGGHILGHTRSNAGVFLWLHRARLGQLGTFLHPCWHERLHEESEAATESQMRAIFARTCYLCGRNGPGDLAHFATACTSPAMAQRRDAALGNGELTRIILSIAQAIYAVAGREPPITLTASIMAMPSGGAEAKFIVSRIVTGAPWTARQVKPEWATAGKLGTMFDKSYDDSLAAPFADVWAQHASQILQAVGRKWWELLPLQARRTLRRAGIRPAP